MKGQFFIVGALILVIAISAGFRATEFLSSTPGTDLPYISSNLKSEIPRAFNFGFREGTPAQTLANFTLFLNRTLSNQYITFSSFWVAAVGNGSGTLEFTAGNFLNEDVNLTIDIPGDSSTITVSRGSTNSSYFPSVPQKFNVTFSYGSGTRTVEWVRDKANLYCVFGLEREGDLVKEELTA